MSFAPRPLTIASDTAPPNLSPHELGNAQLSDPASELDKRSYNSAPSRLCLHSSSSSLGFSCASSGDVLPSRVSSRHGSHRRLSQAGSVACEVNPYAPNPIDLHAVRRSFASCAAAHAGLHHEILGSVIEESAAIKAVASDYRRWSIRVVQHPFFRNGMNVLIILSAIQMGLEAEFEDPPLKDIWRNWNYAYTVCAALEMILMVDAHRLLYFMTPWMLLDFVLVIMSLATTFVPELGSIRLLRLMRVLRIIRMSKVFPEFSSILEGLLNSIRSMMWIFLLLFVILYAGAVFCVHMLGQKDSGYPAYNEAGIVNEETKYFNNFVHFGTIFRSMLSLLGMLLLSEWSMVKTVGEVHPWMVPFFLGLLVLVTFGVLNVIIGVVVDKTTEAMDEPKRVATERDQQQKAEVAETLADMLFSMEARHDGSISVQELRNCLKNPAFSQILTHLDLPYNFTVGEFLSMLDADGDCALSKHEFVTGLLRHIFSTDWQRHCLNSATSGMLHQSFKKLEQEFKNELRNCIDEIRTEIRGGSFSLNTIREPDQKITTKSSRTLSGISSISFPLVAEGTFRSSPDPSMLQSTVWEPLPPNASPAVNAPTTKLDEIQSRKCSQHSPGAKESRKVTIDSACVMTSSNSVPLSPRSSLSPKVPESDKPHEIQADDIWLKPHHRGGDPSKHGAPKHPERPNAIHDV